MTHHVVFVHGAWMLPPCWDNLKTVFEAAGYITHAPAWPLLGNGTAAELRANPPKGLGALSVTAITDHYQAFIETLPERPIIIGHSMGGLVAQLLMDRRLGAACVAVDPGPVGGTIPGLQSLLAAAPVLLRWASWRRPFTISRAAFAKNFANRAPADAQTDGYDRLVVPTSGKLFWQVACSIGTWVKAKTRTEPMLITVAEFDRTVTPFTARACYNKQKKAPGITDFRLFKGHSHYLLGEPGWQAVAAEIVDWAKRHAPPAPLATMPLRAVG